jgi:hypothetical protein
VTDAISRDLEIIQNARLGDLSPDVRISILLAKVYCAKPCVYFIRFGEFVKIGWSRDVSRRFVDLDIHPEPIEVLWVIPGNSTKEREYHDLFSELHVRREMFRYEGALRDFIDLGRRALLKEAAACS